MWKFLGVRVLRSRGKVNFYAAVPFCTILRIPTVLPLHHRSQIKPPNMKPNIFNQSKKLLLVAALAIFSLSQATAATSEELIRAFNHTFPDARYVRWTEDHDYQVVSFTLNETQCKICYSKEGAIVYSLKYMQENDLPLKPLMAVKKKYKDKQIVGVVELTNANGVLYELTISDDKKWYVVRADAQGGIVYTRYAFNKPA